MNPDIGSVATLLGTSAMQVTVHCSCTTWQWPFAPSDLFFNFNLYLIRRAIKNKFSRVMLACQKAKCLEEGDPMTPLTPLHNSVCKISICAVSLSQFRERFSNEQWSVMRCMQFACCVSSCVGSRVTAVWRCNEALFNLHVSHVSGLVIDVKIAFLLQRALIHHRN